MQLPTFVALLLPRWQVDYHIIMMMVALVMMILVTMMMMMMTITMTGRWGEQELLVLLRKGEHYSRVLNCNLFLSEY